MAPKTRSIAARARSRTPPRCDKLSQHHGSSATSRTPVKTAIAGKATVEPVSKTSLTAVERAAAALKPAGLSGRLPCRDDEQDKISNHLRASMRTGGSEQVLYISGMPGTGKTAAFLEIISELKADVKSKPFVFVHVNAMRLGTPNAIFSNILSHLPGAPCCAASAALGEVQRFFYNRQPSDPPVVLLIDEIDQLVTKSQGVLYSVFEWLSLRGARLVVAAISNTMDLPERLLPRVASRFEVVRVDFWPYTKAQINTILCARLESHDAVDVFKSEALLRCTARVAAGTGDVRKALQLCRRALELRLNETVTQPVWSGASFVVEGSHLEAAVKALLFTNPSATCIPGLSRKMRRFLIGIVMELRHRESDVVPLRQVASRYEKLMNLDGQDMPSSGSHVEDAGLIGERLESMSLIGQQGKSGVFAARGVAQGVMLTLGSGLDIEDLKTALQNAEDDAGFRKLIED